MFLDIKTLMRQISLAIGGEPLKEDAPASFPSVEYDIPGRFAVGISSDGNTCWTVSGITGKPDNDTRIIWVEVFQYISIAYKSTNVTIREDEPANTSHDYNLAKNSSMILSTIPYKFAPDFLPEPSSQNVYTLLHTGSFSTLVSNSESDYNTFRSQTVTHKITSGLMSLVRSYGYRVPSTASGQKYTAGNTPTMIYSYALWQY